MGRCVMNGCVSLFFFFYLQKREIQDKVGGGIFVRRDVSKEGLVIICDEA